MAPPSRGPDPSSEAGSRVRVPGGVALCGTRSPLLPEDEEGPLRRKKIRTLDWEIGCVTASAFRRFVEATGYRTDAERFGWSYVFYDHVPDRSGHTLGVEGLEWWRQVHGATWVRPTGPHGPPATPDHPAVHVSWNDARAYAAWAGGRLPREVEWEHAARGGRGDVRYPWGDTDPDDRIHLPCNIWQGKFPHANTALDGYSGTAPAISFAPNGYGLYNMVGNVWEWTVDPFRLKSMKRTSRRPTDGPGQRKVLKGGSFLCHASYCFRYRIAARTGNTPDSSSAHTGFRVVYETPAA